MQHDMVYMHTLHVKTVITVLKAFELQFLFGFFAGLK